MQTRICERYLLHRYILQFVMKSAATYAQVALNYYRTCTISAGGLSLHCSSRQFPTDETADQIHCKGITIHFILKHLNFDLNFTKLKISLYECLYPIEDL